ncbi:hypothetical protein VZT92_001966 [Zoarces viviparus]
MFSREDVKYGAVDRKLCSNIGTAGTRDKAQRQSKLRIARQRRMELEYQPTTSIAAEKMKQEVEAEKSARKRHMAKQRKRVLEGLVQAKKRKLVHE